MPQHHPKQRKKVDPAVSKDVSGKRFKKIKEQRAEDAAAAAEQAAFEAELIAMGDDPLHYKPAPRKQRKDYT